MESFNLKKLNAEFYDSFIFEECKKEDIIDGVFFDSRFSTEDSLTDDFISSLLLGRMSGVEDAVILAEPIVINGVKSTVFGTYVDSPKGPEICLGSTSVKAPNFEIGEDYRPAKQVLEWYFKYQENPETPFPHVPVAEPIVPHSAKERPISTDDLDAIMEKKGGLIFDPTFSFKESRSSDQYVEFEPTKKKEMDVQVDIKMDPTKHSFLYTSRCNYIWRWNRYKVCSLEFNPFHPLAAPYIEEMNDQDGLIRGRYRWGRRTREFYFNTRSRKYRLHYEVWGSAFSYRNHYLAVFDLVANFDLRELRIFDSPSKICTFAPSFVVQGYFPERVDNFYSSISLPRRSPERVDKIMTFYSNVPVPINFIGQKYYDVTSLYELKYYSMLKWELFVAHRQTGKTIVSLIYSDKKSMQKQEDERLFISFSMRTSSIKVYVKEEDLNLEEQAVAKDFSYFSYCPDCFFFGCPRNQRGSLILNPNIMPISEYMKQVKRTDVDFLTELNCEVVDNTSVEEVLSPEELDRLRATSGNEYFDNFYEVTMLEDDLG